jgi:hypothetical protein
VVDFLLAVAGVFLTLSDYQWFSATEAWLIEMDTSMPAVNVGNTPVESSFPFTEEADN